MFGGVVNIPRGVGCSEALWMYEVVVDVQRRVGCSEACLMFGGVVDVRIIEVRRRYGLIGLAGNQTRGSSTH